MSEETECQDCITGVILGEVQERRSVSRSVVFETPEEALAVLSSWVNEFRAMGYQIAYANLGVNHFGPEGWQVSVEAQQ